MLEQSFKSYDDNGDGVIDTAEFRRHSLLTEHERQVLAEAKGILTRAKDRYVEFDRRLEHKPLELEAAVTAIALLIEAAL